MKQILNQITRILTQKLSNWAMRRATKAMTQSAGTTAKGTKSPASPQALRQQKMARDTAKRARQAAKITRKLGR